MRVLGHRGSRIPGPENTVSAVRAALLAGADGVEVDVRRSRDGVLVCAHDPAVVSPAGPLVVADTTAARLAEAGVPPLVEVLDAALGHGQVVCEVKNVPGQPDCDAPASATGRAVVELLAARRTPDDIVVSSFDWFTVEAVRDAGLRTAFLALPGVALAAALGYAAEAGHLELHAFVGDVLLAGPPGVDAGHAAGLALVAWTVRTPEELAELAALGVDAAICDDPAAAVQALLRTG
ncbi:MAG: glycerophosphodiester phosphodiesterase [Mycobacteriales bacterium]